MYLVLLSLDCVDWEDRVDSGDPPEPYQSLLEFAHEYNGGRPWAVSSGG